VRAEATRLLPGAPVVASWGVYELPLSFYLGRRVVAVQSDDDLRRVMTTAPAASALLTQAALAQVEHRRDLQVVPLDRLNFDRVVLVSHGAGPPPGPARR
jgi:hypothetical protein